MVVARGGKDSVCASRLARPVIDVERLVGEEDDGGGDSRFGDVIDEDIGITE